jgi:hypothetical protein
MTMSRLRIKGHGLIARARQAGEPRERAALFAAGRATLARARRDEAARYAYAVGAANVTLAGYRAWHTTRPGRRDHSGVTTAA